MTRKSLQLLWFFFRLAVLIPSLLLAAIELRTRPRHQPVVTPTAPLLNKPGTITLSVIVPFYNPGDVLRSTLLDITETLRQADVAFELIAVSDGSTDGSAESVLGLTPELTVLVADRNRGKGAALHAGFAQASGEYVGFIDADGDIDPRFLLDYLHRAQAGGYDVVYASKRHPDSHSAASRLRKTVSFGFIAVVGTLFGLDVEDTQTGCKVFRREALATVLPRLQEQRFAFDLEFFVAAKAAGITAMAAAPVDLKERLAGSTVGTAAIANTFRDALAILGRLHFSQTYRKAVDGRYVDHQQVPIFTEHRSSAAVIPFPRSAGYATGALAKAA